MIDYRLNLSVQKIQKRFLDIIKKKYISKSVSKFILKQLNVIFRASREKIDWGQELNIDLKKNALGMLEHRAPYSCEEHIEISRLAAMLLLFRLEKFYPNLYKYLFF